MELHRTFSQLTEKQHEVLRFVSENHTSKEIAYELGISESAVNQRIEAVRSRTGSPPRAELGRAYRRYLQDLEEACNSLSGDIIQVASLAHDDDRARRELTSGELTLADSAAFVAKPPWQGPAARRIVPEVLDGQNAGLSRFAAMIVIAGGLMFTAMVGLGVIRALTDMF